MCDMAPRPRIGTTIRRAMERKRMDQVQLAKALGVSRSAVNAWINDRAWPLNSIGALEELLEVSLDSEPDPEPEPEVLSDELRTQIYRDFSPEDAALAIGVLERTLRKRTGVTSPGEEQAEGQTP